MRDRPCTQSVAWIVQQQGCTESEAVEYRESMRWELRSRVPQLVARIAVADNASDVTISEDDLDRCVDRLTTCIDFHWPRFAREGRTAFSEVLGRLEDGRLVGRKFSANLLFDVVFACSLESSREDACRRFDYDFMPLVRAIAGRKGGERSIEDVENFVAELITPRQSGRPRIASYTGRSPLTYWLGSVVSRFCIDMAMQRRKRKEERLEMNAKVAEATSGHHAREEGECVRLLTPIFHGLARVLDPQNSLMFKMIYLDHVPQKQVAEFFDVHPGNLTRRKQRVATQMGEELQAATRGSRAPQRIQECLELVLASNNPTLRRAVAQVFAEKVKDASRIQNGDA